MKKIIICLTIGSLSFMALCEDFIWNGGNGFWTTASEWTPARVPDINGGVDAVTIGAGIVTNIAIGDWSNNSVVTMTNNSRWIQGGGEFWVRAAGNGVAKSGTLILKDNAVFDCGTAYGLAIGISGGEGVLQVNDNATLNCPGARVRLGSHGANSRGVLDINGGSFTTPRLMFQEGSFAQAQNSFGRLNISGGKAEIGDVVFWNSTATGYDHAINFDGGDGHLKVSGSISLKEKKGEVEEKVLESWMELYDSGKLLINNSKPGEFDVHFNLIKLTHIDDISVRRPVSWKGGVGLWNAAKNWVDDEIPDINSGANSVLIEDGTVEYVVDNGDWSNNSRVSLSNDAKWVQISGTHWIRVAGDGGQRKGTLILNDTSEFNAGTAPVITIGIAGGIGAVVVNDNARLIMNDKTTILGYNTGAGQHNSGTIDLNGGEVKTGRIYFSQIYDNANDDRGANTYGRVSIAGGTFECTGTDRSVLFANITASNYDNAIDFDGESGAFITRGAPHVEYDANTVEEKSWEELFDSGYLLRNGSNAGSFGQHFSVRDLGEGRQSLQLRSYKGTTIILN